MKKTREHSQNRSTSWASLFGLVVVVAAAPGAKVGSGGVPVFTDGMASGDRDGDLCDPLDTNRSRYRRGVADGGESPAKV